MGKTQNQFRIKPKQAWNRPPPEALPKPQAQYQPQPKFKPIIGRPFGSDQDPGSRNPEPIQFDDDQLIITADSAQAHGRPGHKHFRANGDQNTFNVKVTASFPTPTNISKRKGFLSLPRLG